MNNWRVALEVSVVVSAETKEEALKQGVDSASWQFFTTFNPECVTEVKKVKGYYNKLGDFVEE